MKEDSSAEHLRLLSLSSSLVFSNFLSLLNFYVQEYRIGGTLKGNLHRLDGPARLHANGDKEYWVDGKLHRLDGPAKEYKEVNYYYVHSTLHRMDGPAVEYKNNLLDNEYWVNGVEVTDKVEGLKEEEILKYLRLFSL